ncbi:MAG: bh protein [Candidatus Ratteibacteria bacterium]|nr:bh protein [Candidatus Ratteibacteria bacterium]
MKAEIIKTNLYCLHCEKETPHVITYVGGYVHKIECSLCSTELRIDKEKILKFYTSNIIKRLFTKPERLTDELRKDMSSLLTSLPFRIVSKPYRMAKEFFDIIKEK